MPLRFIHTADVHLTRDHPERLDALKKIGEKAENADYLLITGDLFDKGADVEDLKSEVRSVFDNENFQTFLIPGNHDHNAFRSGDHLGNNIEILDDRIVSRELGDVNLVALPYTNESFEDKIEELSVKTEDGKTNILMVHCTLKGGGSDFGDEEEYLPVSKEQLARTGYDYVLAGHIHSEARKWQIGETVFAYSGSPVSISKSETGVRHVWQLDTDTGMKTVPLNTEHYIRKEFDVVPEDEQEILEQIQTLSLKNSENATLLLEIDGFTDKQIPEFLDDVKSAVESSAGQIEVDHSLENMSAVIETDLYRNFKQKLDQREDVDKKRAEKQFLKGYSRFRRSS